MEVKTGSERGSVIGTTGDLSATRLVSGTVVALAGLGLDLTAPAFPAVSVTIVLHRFISPKRDAASRALLAPARKGAKRRKARARLFNVYDMMRRAAEAEQKRESARMAVYQKIAKIQAKGQHTPVKLVGKAGSAKPPTRKSYNLDLDQFQSD